MEKSKLSFKTGGFGSLWNILTWKFVSDMDFFFSLFHSKSWIAQKILSVLSVQNSNPIWSWILEAAALFYTWKCPRGAPGVTTKGRE